MMIFRSFLAILLSVFIYKSVLLGEDAAVTAIQESISVKNPLYPINDSLSTDNKEGGYASSLSVYQGDSLSFFISTAITNPSLSIYRYGKTKELVAAYNSFPGGLQTVKDSSYFYGCRWKPNLGIKIPENWKAGLYFATYSASNDSVNPIFFIVKERNPLLRNDIVVDVSFNTINAYNNFGGKCSYPSYSSNKKFSTNLSFLRPIKSNVYSGICRANIFSFEAKLLDWLEDNGYKADVIADMDLDRDSAYLSSYKVILFPGHSEYWSWNMRKNVEAFTRGGGNVMFLCGNTCYWQVRFNKSYNTMICYKSDNDPGAPKINPMLKTDKWYKILRENNFTGLSYEKGGQVNYGPFLSYKDGYGGFIVQNDQNWVFRGTGLKNGDIFGQKADSSIAGYEVDATSFKYVNGIPSVTGIDQTPKEFRILGITPANASKQPANLPTPGLYGTMGIFKSQISKGAVFNAATIRWVWGLTSRLNPVSAITRNVLDKFLENKYPPEIISYSPSVIKDTIILHMRTFLSQRNIAVKYGSSQAFDVLVNDYKDEDIYYLWTVNDSIVSQNRSFVFNSLNYPTGTYKINLLAYNHTDTSSIQWNLQSFIGNGIALINKPDSILFLGQEYTFRLNSHNYFNRPVYYSVYYLPEWAKFDSINKVISGIPNHVGQDSLLINVSDDQGHKDKEKFRIEIERSKLLNFLNTVPEDYQLYQNYPNPFNNLTHISFYLVDKANVELNIDDIDGRLVRKYDLSELLPGLQTVVWDAKSDSGSSLPSGIYVYQLLIRKNLGGELSFVKKMDYLK